MSVKARLRLLGAWSPRDVTEGSRCGGVGSGVVTPGRPGPLEAGEQGPWPPCWLPAVPQS